MKFSRLYAFAFTAVLTFAVPIPTRGQGEDSIDTRGFEDSAHHWYDIHDEEHVVEPDAQQQRLSVDNVRGIADNILLYQHENGGWPKNYDMRAVLTDAQRQTVLSSRRERTTTFDNGATHSQVDYLAEAFARTGEAKYRDASLRGIDFILSAQYPNGGWPQFWPDTSGYRRYITFNDGAMIGVMKVLSRVTRHDTVYAFVEGKRRAAVASAFTKGLDCILRCQIVVQGGPTAWCQQHDQVSLRPQNARTFEPAAISGLESADIVLFLMHLDRPSPAVIAAVQAAVRWFDRSTLHGIRVDVVQAAHAEYQYHATSTDRVVVNDPAAPPLWARYYELGTNVPLFCNRDGKPVYSLAEVDRERRTGYRWYSDEPASVLKRYPKWQKKWAPSGGVPGR